MKKRWLPISSDFLVTLVEHDYEDSVEGIANLFLYTMYELKQEVCPDFKVSYDISDGKIVRYLY